MIFWDEIGCLRLEMMCEPTLEFNQVTENAEREDKTSWCGGF